MKIWKEKADPEKHIDSMSTSWVGGVSVEGARDNLIPKWVYFVKAEGFTFQFASIRQIEEAREYFSRQVHPSRREFGVELEHYWQKWYERLPKGLTKGSKRGGVLKAFDAAILEFGA